MDTPPIQIFYKATCFEVAFFVFIPISLILSASPEQPFSRHFCLSGQPFPERQGLFLQWRLCRLNGCGFLFRPVRFLTPSQHSCSETPMFYVKPLFFFYFKHSSKLFLQVQNTGPQKISLESTAFQFLESLTSFLPFFLQYKLLLFSLTFREPE